MLSEDWIQYYLLIADAVRTKSKDKSTQIGSVIFREEGKEIISSGYNSFPRGIKDDKLDRQERPEKYYWMCHSEENAIVNAARIGVSTEGSSILIVGGFPCTACTRKIINAGIRKVYVTEKSILKNVEKWEEEAKRSKQMFDEAFIELIILPDEKLPNE